MKIYQLFSRILRVLIPTGVLIISGCNASTLSASDQNLPAPLQKIVGSNQTKDETVLYHIPGLSDRIRSLVVSENGMFFVNVYDRGGFFSEDTMDYHYGIAPARSIRLIAKGGDARTVYLSSVGNGVWKLSSDNRKPSSIGGPENIEELATSPDSKIVYAKVGDTFLWRKDGDEIWNHIVVYSSSQEDLDSYFGIESEGDWTVGTNGVYKLVVTVLEDYSGVPADYSWDIEHYSIEQEKWETLGWNLGNSIGPLSASGDGKDIWMQSPEAIWSRGKVWPTKDTQLDNQIVTALLFDPQEQNVLYVGTKEGLYISEAGNDWKKVSGDGQGRAVNAIVYHPRWKLPIVATNNGLYFVIRPQPSQLNAIGISIWQMMDKFYRENHQKVWFWPITTAGGFLAIYITGILGLLLWAWRGGSVVFGRQPIIEIVSRPLVVTPGLGRWALFLGYKQRLANHRLIKKVSRGYFGLPASDPAGSPILPDQTGDALHQRINEMLGEQQPVLIVGKGGAGKTTLLARWAFLALHGHLPLKGYIPILVTADYYEGNLIQAISHALRQRDGVAVNERTIEIQLQSGKFLILFDGLSEVEVDTQESLQEILCTARNADFRMCRFLIATRPLEKMQGDVATLYLQPLSLDSISLLLPLYVDNREQVNQVIRQLQAFGSKTIDPLLFTLALQQNNAEKVSITRAELYERYFRRLLRVESDVMLWYGWRTALEDIAEWSLLRTGKRGVGLPHVPLIDLLSGKGGDSQPAEQVVERLQRYFHLPVKDELDLLNQLEAAGILQSGRRWHFVHDTFEEYFAASYLVSSFEQQDQLPLLDKWIGVREREQEFLEVLDFVREIADTHVKQNILKFDLPSSWKERLTDE